MAQFIKSITLTHITPCLAEPGKYIVSGKPSSPLNKALPYLASLPNVIGFNPHAPALTMRRKPGFITLYSERVIITQVADLEEGLKLLEALRDAINATWENRHDITPVSGRKKPPRPLDVYALLPQTNCKQCGEATCMAFAFRLLLGKGAVEECVPLLEEQFIERYRTLKGIID